MELPFETEPDRAAAEQFLVSRIDYERELHIPYGRRNFKLDRMTRLAERLGNPQADVNIIHVAGTKGKGSTSAMIASILTAAGYRVGLYTSPHLETVEERFVIDGVQCTTAEFVDLVDRLRPVVEEFDADAAKEDPPALGPTYFDVLTAMALVYFADRRVDFAVLEVGLGGRLDSTNICLPVVSVITSISFDHMKQLGNTLAEIAGEKAGIIKAKVPVVSGVTEAEPRDVIRQIAQQHGSRLHEQTVDFETHYAPPQHLEAFPAAGTIDFVSRQTSPSTHLENIKLALVGQHQAKNAAVALATIEELRQQGFHVDEAAIRNGLGQMSWPARVEIIARQPTVVLDTAHNLASMVALLTTLEQSFSADRRILVFAATRDKPVREMLAQLVPYFHTIVFTQYYNNPRSVPVDELAAYAAELNCQSFQICATAQEAWQAAKHLASPKDLVVITGSFFIAAEMRAVITADSPAIT